VILKSKAAAISVLFSILPPLFLVGFTGLREITIVKRLPPNDLNLPGRPVDGVVVKHVGAVMTEKGITHIPVFQELDGKMKTRHFRRYF